MNKIQGDREDIDQAQKDSEARNKKHRNNVVCHIT